MNIMSPLPHSAANFIIVHAQRRVCGFRAGREYPPDSGWESSVLWTRLLLREVQSYSLAPCCHRMSTTFVWCNLSAMFRGDGVVCTSFMPICTRNGAKGPVPVPVITSPVLRNQYRTKWFRHRGLSLTPDTDRYVVPHTMTHLLSSPMLQFVTCSAASTSFLHQP